MSPRLPYRGLAITGVVLILAGCLAGIIVPAGLGWDFANFYDAGHKALVGQVADLYDPTSRIAGEEPQGRMTFWGVPISSYFYAPLAWLPPRTALTVFKIQNTLAIFIALLILYSHTRQFVGHSPLARQAFAAAFVLLALVYQPFWTIYRVGGQTTPTVFLLLVLGLLCHTSSRFKLSAACFVLAVLIKPAFAPGLLLLGLVSGFRFFRATAVLLLVIAGISVLVMGWSIHEEFLVRMLEGSRRSTTWLYNSALTVWIENLRVLSDPDPTTYSRPPLLSALVFMIKVAVLALFVWLYASARARPWSSRARLHYHYLLAVLFPLLIAPVVWEHYLSLLFLPLAYFVAAHRHFSRSALWTVGLIFFFAIGQNLILVNWLDARFTYDSASELLIVGLFKSAPLLLTLVLLWRHRDELFESYAAPAWTTTG
jgi:hypothetical protein